MLYRRLSSTFFLTLFVFFGFTFAVKAQVELQKIAPKAPNTAALLRISENNISHYTGAAEISFPLYTVQSGALQLPLSLSYSSTGNRVEDIASWVGLGWNLGNIPMVARTVRSLPDEHYPGVSVGYPNGQYKLDSLIHIQDLPGHHSGLYHDVVCGIAGRQIDMEPDVFTYTLLDGRSGTFYWDPYQQKYQTHPYRSFKIEKLGAGSIDGFWITDDYGTVYKFVEYETSQSSGTYNSPEERNAWYIQKVYNVNRTDSISFGYSTETIVTKTLNPHRRQLGTNYCPDNSSIMSTTTVQTKIPFQISFRDGYVQFEGASTFREDLEGGYALKALKVYNYRNELLKTVSFSYTYTTATTPDPLCNLISSRTYEKKRLFLTSFTEKGAAPDTLKYSFEYNTSIESPCRVSSAQDFWGYYNGEIYNENLLAEIPARFGFTTLAPGAIRFIDTTKNQFGILQRITYPTGGKTEISYETHRIESAALPAVYLDKQTFLTDEHEFSTRVYIDTINIYSDEDKFINAWEYGGSFVDIILGDKECVGGTPPPNCAEFYVRGLDPGNSDISFPVSGDIHGHRLKKGRYEIKASFGQAHETTQGFFMLVKWREVDTTVRYKYVGGLRVKQIRQMDSYGNTMKKEYKYQTSLNSDSSSGVSLGDVNLFRIGITGCEVDNVTQVESYLLQQSSATVNSFGGSFVGYNRVFEMWDSLGSNGYRELEFLPFEVILDDEFPYKPVANVNEFRAKPIYIKDYRKSEGSFQLLNEQYFHYNEIFFPELAFDALATSITHPCPEGDGQDYTGNLYYFDVYQLIPALCNVQYQVTKRFDPSNGSVLIQTDSFFYNSKNYQPNKVVTRNSKGQLLEKVSSFSVDSSSSGLDSDVWAAMIEKNLIGVPTKVVSKVNGSVTETLISKFDYEASPERLLLKELYHSYGTATPALRAQFSFSPTDQLLEQQKVKDVKETYLWGYGGRYPVAKLVNTTHAVASGYVNSIILNNPSSDEALRAELANLFNITGAQVEYYTYRPGYGVSSMTDTRGRTSYYEYDGHGRLAFILDHDKKVLKKYCYNYAGQPTGCTVYYNIADSANYTRNNCGTGYVGSTVKYVVPANKYSSYASQADANAMADADIAANGQAYANANGTCTQVIYARLTYENYNYSYSNAVHADIVVRFYSDAACTIPLSVSNLTIQLSTEGFDGSNTFSYDYPETVSGYSFMVEASAELSYDDGMNYRFKDYYLSAGSGYTVVW